MLFCILFEQNHENKIMLESEIGILSAKFFSVTQRIANIPLHHSTKEEFHIPSQIQENPTY